MRFSFTGESHDFWELVYADKGDVTVFADDKSFVLEQGNVIFHKPNEWHNVRANGVRRGEYYHNNICVAVKGNELF